MTNVAIGMRRSRARLLANEILAAPEDEALDITLYCHDNESGGEVVVNISNDDMERDEVADDEIYVEIDQD